LELLGEVVDSHAHEQIGGCNRLQREVIDYKSERKATKKGILKLATSAGRFTASFASPWRFFSRTTWLLATLAQQLCHCAYQRVQTYRFRQVAIETGSQCAIDYLGPGKRRQSDRRNRSARFVRQSPNPSNKIEAVFVWHGQVAEDKIRSLSLKRSQALGYSGRSVDRETEIPQKNSQQYPGVFVILENEDMSGDPFRT
jgi:hypothetical protein